MAGRETLSALARGSLKRAAALADRAHSPRPGLVVLIYHRVGRRTRSRVDLPEWLFEEQMARIAAGPGAIPLGAGVDMLQSVAGSDHRSVVVTFDDGTADFVDVALPILTRYGVPTTLYLATEFIETGKAFPQSGMAASWEGIRDAVSTGLVTVGSHTHSHMLLDRVSADQAAGDLDRSIELIRDRLAVDPEHFAYPKAVLGTPAVEAEVRARFRSAAVAGTRTNPYGCSNPYRLARSPIQIEDGLRFFERKLSGGMWLEDGVRAVANRRRFSGLKS